MKIRLTNNSIHGGVSEGVLQRFRTLFYTGCAVSVLLVLLLGLLSVTSLDRQRSLALSVGQCYQVLAGTDSLQAHFQVPLVTSRPAAFRYNTLLLDGNGEQRLLAQVNALQTLVQGDPEQAARVSKIRQMLRKLLSDEKTTIRTATGRVLTLYIGDGRSVPAIAANLAGLKKRASLALAERQAAYQHSGGQTKIAVIGGTVLVLLIVAFLIYIILKELHIRFRAYQQEHELNQLKSSFVTLASHEFRTPLSSILLSAALIEKYAAQHHPEKVAKHSLKIKQVVHNLESILEDFLSLEKLDTGKVLANSVSFDLPALCEDILAKTSLMAKTGQELGYEQTGSGTMVRLDQHLIRNSINNLLFNAIKYAGENARIRLITTISDECVSISVKDNGIGIAEKDQEKLFTMFYRVNESGNIPGTGLGLAIVKRYVQLMNGRLRFYSKPQEETCFEMEFPVYDPA